MPQTNVDSFPTIQDAILEFQTLTGMILRGDDTRQVAALIEENGRSREFVAQLADEVEKEQAKLI